MSYFGNAKEMHPSILKARTSVDKGLVQLGVVIIHAFPTHLLLILSIGSTGTHLFHNIFLSQTSFINNDMMPPPHSHKYNPTLSRADRNNHSYEYVINKRTGNVLYCKLLNTERQISLGSDNKIGWYRTGRAIHPMSSSFTAHSHAEDSALCDLKCTCATWSSARLLKIASIVSTYSLSSSDVPMRMWSCQKRKPGRKRILKN